jgi:hypothetical protein
MKKNIKNIYIQKLRNKNKHETMRHQQSEMSKAQQREGESGSLAIEE